MFWFVVYIFLRLEDENNVKFYNVSAYSFVYLFRFMAGAVMQTIDIATNEYMNDFLIFIV